jgi:hypothetical protein
LKASLQPGVTRVNRITIDRGRIIGFMGEEGRVYVQKTIRRLQAKAAKRADQARGLP